MTQSLDDITASLASRPGHEMVRSQLLRLLTDVLGHRSGEIVFEQQIEGQSVILADDAKRRGRIDALLGRTVFEVKSNLARERDDAERQLTRYLENRKKETGEDFIGVATDGAVFQAYDLSDNMLRALGAEFKTDVANPASLRRWVESVVALRDNLPPGLDLIRDQFGRDSVLFARAQQELEAVWAAQRNNTEARVKRDVWKQLLSQAYGGEQVGDTDLFLRHTYLTVVAKSIATQAFFVRAPITGAEDVLSGRKFTDAGISGAIESDFFDWILLEPRGQALVLKLWALVGRYRFADVEVDVMKGLYESLIDPETRHDLGEYYTPDWLARKICDRVVTEPLTQRVIDPACGSGTFLFHSLRKLVEAGAEADWEAARVVEAASRQVMGIDVHPVAVIFARTTWLLALAETLGQGRPPSFSVPVYLGDALQWNRRELMTGGDLEIIVPEGENPLLEPRVQLEFPEGLVEQPNLFDAALEIVVDEAERNGDLSAIRGWAESEGIARRDTDVLVKAAQAIIGLAKSDRNHIWGYVARNLSRPLWLSGEGRRADVVVGNPPWVAYAKMPDGIKKRFREEMKRYGLWADISSVSGHDLSAYFFARAMQLYMRADGVIAMVLPHSAMTRKPYKPFRSGDFLSKSGAEAQCRFKEVWGFPSRVQPLFPVPSCVMIAVRSSSGDPLPNDIISYSGRLPERDASLETAEEFLSSTQKALPDEQVEVSPYGQRFRAGANLFPRRLVLVERVTQSGRLGQNPHAPVVRGRVRNTDNPPWQGLTPPQGAVEVAYIREVLLGESIAPFRQLDSSNAVIPEDRGKIFDSAGARARGLVKIADWLENVEKAYSEHGTNRRTFLENLNYISQLSSQFPISHRRVVYTSSGTYPASVYIEDNQAVIENSLYWTDVLSKAEGRYLIAMINSGALLDRYRQWQAMGLFGRRHFHKVMWNLPIPRFDPALDLHTSLAEAAEEAEQVAGAQDVEGMNFQAARRVIRDALADDGIATTIDDMVAELLDGE